MALKPLDIPNSCDHTPFFVAICKGYLELAEILLENEMSSVNYKDSEGDTALHWAVILGNSDAVAFLLSHGADPSIKNNYKNNPLMCACLNSRMEIIDMLLKDKRINDLPAKSMYDLNVTNQSSEINNDMASKHFIVNM